mgnify:CR=1 FL=1
MKKERRTFSEWFKDIAGIEGDLKDTLKPAVGYTSGNIMLGGAGYPISMYHQPVSYTHLTLPTIYSV